MSSTSEADRTHCVFERQALGHTRGRGQGLFTPFLGGGSDVRLDHPDGVERNLKSQYDVYRFLALKMFIAHLHAPIGPVKHQNLIGCLKGLHDKWAHCIILVVVFDTILQPLGY